MQRRHLADPEYAYLRPATSCKKADRKWCLVTSFERCDAAAKLAKMKDTYAKDAHRTDRPPGCYVDTNTDTLFYNLNTQQNYPGSSRFGILCELCPKTKCPGKLQCKDKKLVKDKYCDDGNNNCACGWDGGDCCGTGGDRSYCKVCKCLDPEFEKPKYLKQWGGFCADKQNCQIPTRVGCDIAAAELNLDDKKHTKQVRSKYVNSHECCLFQTFCPGLFCCWCS